MRFVLVIINPGVPVVIARFEEEERLVAVKSRDVDIAVVGIPTEIDIAAYTLDDLCLMLH